jgi:hypothetical protein
MTSGLTFGNSLDIQNASTITISQPSLKGIDSIFMRSSGDINLRVANISSGKISLNANRNLVFDGNYPNLTISTT